MIGRNIFNVFCSVPVIASAHPSSSLSKNTNGGIVYVKQHHPQMYTQQEFIVLLAVNGKLAILKNQLIENNENLNQLRKNEIKII